MIRQALCCTLLLAALFLAGCASAEGMIRPGYDFSKLDRLAVVNVSGPVGGEGAGAAIADLFGTELMRRGYLVVERQHIQQLLAEHQLQASAVTTPEDAAQTGRILNVSGLVVVNVLEYGEQISLTAKIIDAEDGGWAWTASGHGTTGTTVATVAGAAVGAVAGASVGHGHHHWHGAGTVVGAVAGGALGGAAAYALTPKQFSQTQKIIAKMCDTLPPRLPTY